MQRAERKLQLSQKVVGEESIDQTGKEIPAVEAGDLRSIIFGLQMFDPSDGNDGISAELNMSELNDMAENVISMRQEQKSEKSDLKFMISQMDPRNGLGSAHDETSASVDLQPVLDEASYRSWVEKFKEASKSNESSNVEMGLRREIPEKKNIDLEARKHKAEEKKLAKWEALGYHSLCVKDPPRPVHEDVLSDSGSVNFVYGDCTDPSKVSPSEPAIIFRLVSSVFLFSFSFVSFIFPSFYLFVTFFFVPFSPFFLTWKVTFSFRNVSHWVILHPKKVSTTNDSFFQFMLYIINLFDGHQSFKNSHIF